MTQVPIQTPETRHEGDGATASFLIGFDLPDVTQMRVTVNGVARTAVTHFNVVGSSVVFVSAPADGDDICFRRVTPIRQTIEFPNQPTMKPPSVEAALNERARVDQELEARAARGIRVPIGEVGMEVPRQSARAGGYAWFSGGGIAALVGAAGLVAGFHPATGAPVAVAPNFVVDSAPATVASRFGAAAASWQNTVSFIRTMGYLTVGDGGGADWARVAIEPDHEGKFQSADGAWWEIIGAQVNVRAMGAIGDGDADDTAAFQAANSVGRNIFVPGVDDHYRVTSQIHLTANGQHVIGEGRRSRVIQEGAEENAIVFYGDGLDNVGVRDCWLTPGEESAAQLLGFAVHFRGCSRVAVEGVAVSQHRRGAVLLEGCSDAKIWLSRAFDSVVDHETDDHTTSGYDFAVMNGGRDIEIYLNTAENGAGVGFAVQSQALPGGAAPFQFDNVRIHDNVARGQGMYGFMTYRRQASDVWTSIVLSNNLAEDVTGATHYRDNDPEVPLDRRFGCGFYIQGVEDVDVLNNRAVRCGTDSNVLTLAPGGFGWQNLRVLGEVSGNVSIDSGQYGFFVGDPNGEGTGTPLTRLGSNVSRRSRLDGFAFLSIPYPVIEGGESVGSTEGSGLRISDSGGPHLTARSNINGLKCRGNAANGIAIAAGGSIIDNVLAETSATDGVQITATGKTHVIRNSRFVSNGARGLLVVAGSARVETRSNQFEDNLFHISAESPIVGLRSNTYVDISGAPNAGNAKLIDTYGWIRTLADGAAPTIYAEEWVKSGGTTAITSVAGLGEGETATFIAAHDVTLLGKALLTGQSARIEQADGTVRVVSVSA